MSLPPIFPSATEFHLVSDDQYSRKWHTVHDNLSVPDTFNGPDDLSVASVGRWNTAVNKVIKYLHEPDSQDDWQIPAYTLNIRTGDCEDFGILKYATLLRAGLPESNLRLVLGRIAAMPDPLDHAWCAAYLDRWRVLDNKFDILIRPEDYINWWPVAAVWADQAVHFGKPVMLSESV